MKHLLHFKDWTGDEIRDLLEKAVYIKNNPERFSQALKQKTLAMVFQKTSTRTRVSFETGMNRMGGHAIYMDWRTTNLLLAEVKDEIRFITGNADMVMARLFYYKDLAEMAEYSYTPVINGCCNMYHPCQAAADYLTLKEKLGDLEGKKLVYAGVWNNTFNSLIDMGTKLGMEVVGVCPLVNEPSWDEELVAQAEKTGLLRRSLDLKAEAKDADAVYTDSWVDMEFFLDPEFEEEKKKRVDLMLPYQLNQSNLQGSKALIMHDMPIHVGYEMDRDTVEDERSVIFPQSWNRMHAQNAILLKLFGVI